MDKKRIYGTVSIVYCLCYFVIFLAFYLPNYALTLPDEAVGTYLVVREILERFVGFILPATAAATVFTVDIGSTRNIILRALQLASTSAVYYIPYCYLYALSLGFDSVEAICISPLMTLCDILIGAAHTVALVALGYFVARLVTLKNTEECDRSDVRRLIGENMVGEVFDHRHGATAGILAMAIGELAISLVSEIYDTVTYLIEDAGMYGAGEVMYIMLTYALLIGETVLCHIVCAKIKNKIHNTLED